WKAATVGKALERLSRSRNGLEKKGALRAPFHSRGIERPTVWLAGVSVASGCSKQRHQQQCDDVDDLDQWIDRRPGGVLVRIAHRIARYGRLVRLGALAAEVSFLDVLLGVVPGAAAGAHRDCHEQ